MSCSTCSAKALLNTIDTDTITDESCGKQNSYDWLKDLPDTPNGSNIIEVAFKNTRKEFYINDKKLDVKRGDYIAVAADRGHDIGLVTLTGKMAELQVKRKHPRKAPDKVVYRKASKVDIEKWHKYRLLEASTLIKARQIADRLKLDMKISDVEYQGDGSKATFYYIADGRVDFRELIKLYARDFSVKIEMRQIGARQEAAMVGGIGSCGRELCCSTWRVDLNTVLTNAARIQALSHNAQKLTGQCGKLKCCLMYELDSYLEAKEEFPDILLELEVDEGTAIPQKRDLLKRVVYYGIKDKPSKSHIPVPLDRVKEVIQLNKRGIKPEELVVGKVEKNNLEFVTTESDLKLLPKNKSKKSKSRNNKKRFKKRKNFNGKKQQKD